MAIRKNFPEAGSSYMGGESDGWEYETAFAGSSIEATYSMVKQFLQEEGYGDIPLPANAAELLLFKTPKKNGQFLLFSDWGYIHNPVKILFSANKRLKNTLFLHLYNEKDPKHLLRFYGLI